MSQATGPTPEARNAFEALLRATLNNVRPEARAQFANTASRMFEDSPDRVFDLLKSIAPRVVVDNLPPRK